MPLLSVTMKKIMLTPNSQGLMTPGYLNIELLFHNYEINGSFHVLQKTQVLIGFNLMWYTFISFVQ